MTYLIPKRMKEEIKLCSKPMKIYLRDLAVMGVIVGAGWMLSSCVYPSLWLLIPYCLYVAFSALYLTRPAPDNPGKRRWEAIIYLLARHLGRPWFKSIDNPKRRIMYVPTQDIGTKNSRS